MSIRFCCARDRQPQKEFNIHLGCAPNPVLLVFHVRVRVPLRDTDQLLIGVILFEGRVPVLPCEVVYFLEEGVPVQTIRFHPVTGAPVTEGCLLKDDAANCGVVIDFLW